MPLVTPAPCLALALLLAGCAHAGPAADATATEPAAPSLARADEAPPARPSAAPERPPAGAQVITFDGDDAEPEPTSPVRGAPPRPPLPRFRLFGTRSGDGP